MHLQQSREAPDLASEVKDPSLLLIQTGPEKAPWRLSVSLLPSALPVGPSCWEQGAGFLLSLGTRLSGPAFEAGPLPPLMTPQSKVLKSHIPVIAMVKAGTPSSTRVHSPGEILQACLVCTERIHQGSAGALGRCVCTPWATWPAAGHIGTERRMRLP